MQNITAQNIPVKESERQKERKKKFRDRFTLENVLKILYILLTVSFDHGIFGLIIYFVSNKKYSLGLTILVVVAGSIRFIMDVYKVLYSEEVQIKKMIWKHKLKQKLIILNNSQNL